MKTILTADCHCDSKTVMSMRPFSCPADHDDYMLDRINSMADRNDRVVIAGDFCSRGAEHLLARILCKNVYLIIGNHDKAQSVRKFKAAELAMEIKIKDEYTYVSHYPHAFWPRSHRNSFHLYGHVHAEREDWLDIALPGRRSLDIGLDNAKRLLGDYRPFTEEEVFDLLSVKPGHDPIEYYAHRRALRGEVGPHEMGNFDA